MNINSYCPVKVICGKHCIAENSGILKQYGKRCLIVTGGSSARLCGALSDVENALQTLGIAYKIFDGITQNPYTADCHRAGELAREFGADFIFGIGGGSPLDASKAIAIYAANSELAPADIYALCYQNKPLPVILAGTTAGTGSEVTGVSVLTNSENHIKKSISGDDCYAAVAFCDYTYTLSVNRSFSISTCLDAFAHAYEAYFSKVSNELSDVYSEKAFQLLVGGLRFFDSCGDYPDEDLREKLYIGSLFAGLALNMTGTCFPHTLGYVLTEDFNIPHGKACAAFFEDFWHMANENAPEKAQRMLTVLDITSEEIVQLISRLAAIDVKMTQEQIISYGKRWSGEIKNFSRTPGSFTKDTAVEVLRKFKF